MKNILTAVLILLSVSLFSQEKREIIKGEEFIVHTIKQGETLYGISKKYGVTKKELRNSNSGLLLFIKTDQTIYIPISDEKRTIHVVEKGETLYGIAKRYNLSTDELAKLNPNKTVSLKVGEILKLKNNATSFPSEKETNKDSTPKVQKEYTKGEGDIHTVVAGETLYAIARKYKLTVEDLLKLNPQIKNNAISVGDKLNIPKQTITPLPVNELKYVEYKVEKGETLYGISKKFNTTVEEITKLNPSVSTLKEGDILKINVPEKGTDQIKIDLGNPHSTAGSNFDTINKINPLKDKLNDMVMKEAYTVSLFLPFMLDENDKTVVVANKPKKINPDTEKSTQFYQGAKLAFDTARFSGVSINLNVFDSENDTNTINKLLRTQTVKSSDLIIGPFYESPYAQVAKFSKSNNIQAVSPVLKNNFLLFNNENVTQIQTSLPTQLSYLAHYIAQNKNTENVICIAGKSKKEKYLDSSFKDQYNDLIAGKTNNYRSKIGEYKMTSFSSMDGFDKKLVKGKKNILIIPLTEKGMANTFFTQLNILMSRSRMRGYEVEVYALENVMGYDNINIDLKMKFNLHVASSSFIDYKDENVKNFVKKYRAEYGTEPSQFAFIGYDVAFYHALAMSNYGKNFSAFYAQIQVPLLQSTYQLKRTDDKSGFENQSVFILQYKDYELMKVK